MFCIRVSYFKKRTQPRAERRGFPDTIHNNGESIPMLSPAFDILLKRDASDVVWIEAASDLEAAKSRVRELAASCKGEYVIFDQRTRKVVAEFCSSNAII